MIGANFSTGMPGRPACLLLVEGGWYSFSHAEPSELLQGTVRDCSPSSAGKGGCFGERMVARGLPQFDGSLTLPMPVSSCSCRSVSSFEALLLCAASYVTAFPERAKSVKGFTGN